MPTNPSRAGGFTLIELLVVVSIITVLVAILLPTLEGAVEEAKKAKCGANLKVIHTGVIDYAQQNAGGLFICRGRQVQLGFDADLVNEPGSARHSGGTYNRPEDFAVDWTAAMATVGLATREKVNVGTPKKRHNPLGMWVCPSMTAGVAWNTTSCSVTYQYLGGIERWLNPFGGLVESRSPVRATDSRGSWVLAADGMVQLSGPGTWGSGGYPGHQASDKRPTGGNQVHMDGSVAWVGFEETLFIHSWNASRPSFFRQTDLGDYKPSVGASATDPAWR